MRNIFILVLSFFQKIDEDVNYSLRPWWRRRPAKSCNFKKKIILTVVESFILTSILLFWNVCKGQYGKRNLDKEKLWFPREDLKSKLVTMSQLDALSTELQTTYFRPWAGSWHQTKGSSASSGQHELRRRRVFLPSWFCVICTPSKRVIILIWLKKAEKRLSGRISRMVVIHELGAYIRYISNERPAY